jgi:hypothetical protein
MFDLFKLFNENASLFEKLPKFLDEWVATMKSLRGDVAVINQRNDAIDSKLQTIIDALTPTAVTPDIHSIAETQAAFDPRNIMTRGYPHGDGTNADPGPG